jgi:reverse gyrase
VGKNENVGDTSVRYCIYKVVVNLSSKPLNTVESSLLSTGLKQFSTPPKINVRELDEDLDQCARRLRIKEYFNSKKENSEDLSRSDIKHNVDVHVPKTDNLTQTERSALRNLQERHDIFIKPADKGSAVVVMDKTTYLQEAERQLSDCRFYEKLDSDPTLDFTQKIKRALEAI